MNQAELFGSPTPPPGPGTQAGDGHGGLSTYQGRHQGRTGHAGDFVHNGLFHVPLDGLEHRPLGNQEEYKALQFPWTAFYPETG